MSSEDASQKLFRLPGTIEEEDSLQLDKEPQQRFSSRAESPLLSSRINSAVNNVSILPNSSSASGITRNTTLLRVNTQSSSITGIGRQDSTRSAVAGYIHIRIIINFAMYNSFVYLYVIAAAVPGDLAKIFAATR